MLRLRDSCQSVRSSQAFASRPIQFDQKATLVLQTIMTQPIKETFDAQGFVILPNLIPSDLRVELEQASENVISKTRSGAWQHRRVVGKQFPPYGNDGVDSWGVQHVMHPGLGEPAFANWYSSHELREAVKELLGCSDDDLQMGMRGLYGYPDRSADQGRHPIIRVVQSAHQPRISRFCLAMASR